MLSVYLKAANFEHHFRLVAILFPLMFPQDENDLQQHMQPGLDTHQAINKVTNGTPEHENATHANQGQRDNPNKAVPDCSMATFFALANVAFNQIPSSSPLNPACLHRAVKGKLAATDEAECMPKKW